MTLRSTLLAALAIVFPTTAAAQDARQMVAEHVEQHAQQWGDVALRIWDYAEVGYQETESSALLREQLAEAGFAIEAGVVGMPTAFVAEWGSGGPVIAILAEFDALPGITNEAIPERAPHPEHTAGHACGHHLFGAGSVGAAVAVKHWLETSGTPGRIRVYGTPAEEGGSGKVYMVREGLFDDVDVALDWHPSSANAANAGASLANKSAKFRFTGISSHAAGSPENGRSALDGVEAMNMMTNMLREHVPEKTRIHYVITSGGSAPNVVPDFAEVFYYVRHPDWQQVNAIFDRVAAAARGAAMGTETEVDWEIIHGNHALVPNVTLARAMHANLTEVGGVHYDTVEMAFARGIQETLFVDPPPLEMAARVLPFQILEPGGAAVPASKRRGIFVVAAIAVAIAIVAFLMTRGGEGPAARDLAIQHNELGQSYEAANNLDGARAEYRAAIAADATYAVPYNNLATLEMRGQNWARADSLLQRALGLDEAYAAAHFNRGGVLWEMDDLAGAEREYRAAIAADPSEVLAYSNLGVLLLEQDRLDGARDALEAGETANPLSAPLVRNLGRLSLAEGDTTAAVSYLRRALSLSPGDPVATRILDELQP